LIRLPDSLLAWDSAAFDATLASELRALGAGSLPLSGASGRGGYVNERDISVRVLDARADQTTLHAKVGIFFTEMLASCSCGDEPTSHDVYCEMRIAIEKATAKAEFTLVRD
jgi:hypothetical protein